MIAEADLPRGIWRHHLRLLDAVGLVENTLRDQNLVTTVSATSSFHGLTKQEANSVIKEMLKEIDLQTTLALLAGVEAIIRSDYVLRAKGRSSPKALPAPVTKVWKKSASRVRFETLLDAWRDASKADPHVVGAFKSLFDLRHWLAHGRHWPPKGFAGKDTHEVLKVARALQKEIADLPKLVDWD